MEVWKCGVILIVLALVTPILAIAYGWIAGLYQATREATFRLRALQLMGTRGKTDEFLIVSGDPGLVQEVYRVVIATTARVQESRDRAANNTDEGIGINDEEQNTNRSA